MTSQQPVLTASSDNPFFAMWTTPFGVPPFERIRPEHFSPAFERAFAEHEAEIKAIAENSASPTFDNTIVALERSGVLLQRVDNAFGRLNACNTNAQMQKIDTRMAPQLAAHADAIQLDPALWARVDALYARRATLHLEPEQLQLLGRYHTEMLRDGARLTITQKARLRVLNAEISTLRTRFKQNVLKATADSAVVVDDVADLQGLSAAQIGAATQAAAARGLAGKWLIANPMRKDPMIFTTKVPSGKLPEYRASTSTPTE